MGKAKSYMCGAIEMEKKDLTNMGYEEYLRLQATGMFWEFYPEATGVWVVDTREEKEDE